MASTVSSAEGSVSLTVPRAGVISMSKYKPRFFCSWLRVALISSRLFTWILSPTASPRVPLGVGAFSPARSMN